MQFFLKGVSHQQTNKQILHPFKKIGFRYVETIENRPKQFYNFSLNFDFKKFQKVRAPTKITTKSNSTNKGTFIHRIIIQK